MANHSRCCIGVSRRDAQKRCDQKARSRQPVCNSLAGSQVSIARRHVHGSAERYFNQEEKIFKNPRGILVLHSPAGNALWSDIQTVDGSPFKGLMIMDNLFHIHMDILGAVAILTPNTVRNSCTGNLDHWIRYSAEALEKATQGSRQEVSASWKSRLKVISWYE